MINATDVELAPLSEREAAEIEGGRTPLAPASISQPLPPMYVPFGLTPVLDPW
jgi:hypothetical protein